MKRPIKIKENSWLAKLGAKRLKSGRVALVFRHTIHLYNVSSEEFLSSKTWVLHELKHVEQYERLGTIGFLWKYLLESRRNGYLNNSLEQEARNAEKDENLLQKYEIAGLYF